MTKIKKEKVIYFSGLSDKYNSKERELYSEKETSAIRKLALQKDEKYFKEMKEAVERAKNSQSSPILFGEYSKPYVKNFQEFSKRSNQLYCYIKQNKNFQKK